MNLTTRIIGLLVLAIGCFAMFPSSGPKPEPTPAPNPTPAIEVPEQVKGALLSGFEGKQREASYWAGLLYGLARSIEQDAGHPAGPRLTTMVDIERLRNWTVAAPPKAIAGGDVIGQALGPELAKLGTATEILDQDGRRASLVKLLDGSAAILEGLTDGK